MPDSLFETIYLLNPDSQLRSEIRQAADSVAIVLRLTSLPRNSQMANTLALMLLISGSSSADAEHHQISPAAPLKVSVATNHEPSPETRRAASRDRILRRRMALRGGQQDSMSGLISLIQSNVAPDCWELGGTNISTANGTGNGTGNSLQNAENLVELIEQTTQPPSWQINGGNGSISIFLY